MPTAPQAGAGDRWSPFRTASPRTLGTGLARYPP
jgi:hypothetical protein